MTYLFKGAVTLVADTCIPRGSAWAQGLALALISSILPVQTQGRSSDGARAWVPATRLGDLDHIPCSVSVLVQPWPLQAFAQQTRAWGLTVSLLATLVYFSNE